MSDANHNHRSETERGVEVPARESRVADLARTAIEVARYFANTFTPTEGERNARYADPALATSVRGVERMLHRARTSTATEDRLRSKAQRREDWSYGLAGRVRLAVHKSDWLTIARNKRVRHPSQVPGYVKR